MAKNDPCNLPDDLFQAGDLFSARGKKGNVPLLNDCVIASRIQLHRNLKDECFPICAPDAQLCRLRDEILNCVKQVMRSNRIANHCFFPDSLPADDRAYLAERFLLGEDLTHPRHGGAFCVTGDKNCTVTVNGSDHLLLQTLSAGNAFRKDFRKIHKLDDDLSQKLDYAFSPELGYLTSSPLHTGTGMRLSALMYLPGLEINGELPAVLQALKALRMTCRKIWNGGKFEGAGNLLLISNTGTLGETEEEVLARMGSLIDRIALHEKKARRILLGSRRDFLLNHVSCAYGLLRHAYQLEISETAGALSLLLMGQEMGLFHSFTAERIAGLLWSMQNAHLQKQYGKPLAEEELLSARGTLMRGVFAPH